MGLKLFLSGLFYKKNLKNIIIFLIALISLMLIFGNNNLVLNEGLTLNEEIAQTKDSNILALKKNKNYEKIEKNYNEDTFANIESFEVKKKPMPKCDNQNNAQYMKGIDVNKFVHDACLQSKYSAAQR